MALQTALEYADGVFVSTPDLLEFVPGASWLPQPVEVARLQRMLAEEPVQANDRPLHARRPVRVAHGPSNRTIKGTRYIVEAVEELARRGYNTELVMVENKPHEEALKIYAACDVAVDQVLVGSYGLFAVETMALGKPTMCYLRDDVKTHYPQPCPVIPVSPENLVDILEQWATHPEWWAERGAAGRKYVREVHDHVVVGRQCLDRYRRSLEPTSLDRA